MLDFEDWNECNPPYMPDMIDWMKAERRAAFEAGVKSVQDVGGEQASTDAKERYTELEHRCHSYYSELCDLRTREKQQSEANCALRLKVKNLEAARDAGAA